MSVTCSPCTSPAVSPRNSLSGLVVPEKKSPVRVRSAPVSPRRDSHGFLRDFGTGARSMTLVSKEGDGHHHSSAALTNGGGVDNNIPTLTVRRSSKNSSNSPNLLGGSLKDHRHHRRRGSHQNVISGSHNHNHVPGEHRYRSGFMKRPFRSHESLTIPSDAIGAASAVPEHSCLSANTSPRRCSPVFTDQNDYLPLRESFRRSQRYYRRRSSLAQVEMTTAIWREQAENRGRLSAGDALAVTKRGSSSSLLSAPHPHHHMKRHSAPSVSPSHSPDRASSSSSNAMYSSSRHAYASHAACSSSAEAINTRPDNPSLDPEAAGRGESEEGQGSGSGSDTTAAATGKSSAPATERGDIKFSFQYFPATRRLKLLLIRAENLHFPERPDVVLNPFFKVSSFWLSSLSFLSY